MIRFAPATPAAKMLARPRCRRTLVERMADDIREIGGAGEPVTEAALIGRGYSAAIIARFAETARAEARRRFIRQV